MLAPLNAPRPGRERRSESAPGNREELRATGDLISSEDIARLTSPPPVARQPARRRDRRPPGAERASGGGSRRSRSTAPACTTSPRAIASSCGRSCAGCTATERLRFDHPGLGTIATRSGEALVIQNDLGETDAHVVGRPGDGRIVTITYTDVHLARLLFFQGLFSLWGSPGRTRAPERSGDARVAFTTSRADGSRPTTAAKLERSSSASAPGSSSSSTGTGRASGCAARRATSGDRAAELGGGAGIRAHRLLAGGGRRARLRRAGVRRRPGARAGETLQGRAGHRGSRGVPARSAADLRRGPAGRKGRSRWSRTRCERS